jgi:hypothetical protein
MKRLIIMSVLLAASAFGCATRPLAKDRPLHELVPLSHSADPLPADLTSNDRTIIAAMRISAARIAAEKQAQGR